MLHSADSRNKGVSHKKKNVPHKRKKKRKKKKEKRKKKKERTAKRESFKEKEDSQERVVREEENGEEKTKCCHLCVRDHISFGVLLKRDLGA